MPANRTARVKTLSAGRPKTITGNKNAPSYPSSKQGRSVIRRHHVLNKEYAQATSARDESRATKIKQELDALGGIAAYQEASRAGQSTQRGGDTSRVLVDWLKELDPPESRLRLLEVGALALDNACARSNLFDMTRIDLHSTIPGIKQEDFLARAIPNSEEDRFDCVSLSLVVNYVPDAKARGEMLRRTTCFLRRNASDAESRKESTSSCVFLVLPAPCLTNSRYLTQARLEAIMYSLGFTLDKKKTSAKLIYQLWRFTHPGDHTTFGKVEVNPGKQRNNFAIVLEARP